LGIIQLVFFLIGSITSRTSLQDLEESGDSFLDYLNAKPEREVKETAGEDGKTCIFCGSGDVASNGYAMWKCRACGKQFRKHRA
jgi:hypothetical protein